MANDVFISHASADHELAARLCAALEADGMRCWMAPRDIPPGADWSTSIVDAIRESRALVLLLSSAANQSIQIPRELERAVNARVPIVPLRVENVLPAGPLEYSLATVHWLNAFDAPVESHARALAERIESLRALTGRERAEAEARRAAATAQHAVRRKNALRRSAAVSLALAGSITAATSFLWSSGPLTAADRPLLDWRFSLSSPVAPDERIVVVSIDDQTLAGNPNLLASGIDAFGRTLSRIAEAGARVIAIDLLLSERWSQSVPFADFVVRHHERLTLAAQAGGDGRIVGTEAAGGIITTALGPPDAGRMFAFVNFPEDAEGRPRRLPRGFVDSSGIYRPSLAEHAAARFAGRAQPADGSAFIDFRIDPARLRRVSWRDVAMLTGSGEPVFRDRLVLVGVEYEGARDVHQVPAADGRAGLSGVLVQAIAVDTILAGQPIRAASRGIPIGLTVVLGFLAAFAAAASRSFAVSGAALVAAAATFTALAAAVFLSRQSVLPITGPVTAIALTAASSVLVARRRAV